MFVSIARGALGILRQNKAIRSRNSYASATDSCDTAANFSVFTDAGGGPAAADGPAAAVGPLAPAAFFCVTLALDITLLCPRLAPSETFEASE